MAERGYQVEISDLVLPPSPSDEECDRIYERVRKELHAFEDKCDPPLAVELTRRAMITLGDDELAAALEIVRDAMVDVLGVPSDDRRVDWHFAQRQDRDSLLIRVEPA